MMHFHVGKQVTFLFKSWTAAQTKDFIPYLVLTFALAVFYECLRGFQKYFIFKLLISGKRPTSQQEKDVFLRKRLIRHVLSTLMYMTQLTFGYMVMLLVMTYNSFVFLMVMIGIIVGFYLSEPLILRGIESVYYAKLAKRQTERQRGSLNGHGRLLQNDNLECTS